MQQRARRQIFHWLGEFFREGAVLIAVLAPMELLIQNGFLTLRQLGLIFLVTIMFAGTGFYLGLKGNAGQTDPE